MPSAVVSPWGFWPVNDFHDEIAAMARAGRLDFIVNSALDHNDRLYQGGDGGRLRSHRLHVRLKIDEEKCDKCYSCLICPGIEAGPDSFPHFTNLCSGRGGQGAQSCQQMCPFNTMKPLVAEGQPGKGLSTLPEPPELPAVTASRDLIIYPACFGEWLVDCGDPYV